MRQAIAVGFSVLVLVAFPLSARSGSTSDAYLAGAMSAFFVGMTCWSAAVAEGDNGAGKDDYARRGWLVGVAGSYAIETFKDDAESDFQKILGPTASLSVDNSLGINGRAGYRCHRWFSAEVEVEWLNGFEADLSVASFSNTEIDVEPLVVTANVKGYFLTGRYQPFLLVGAGGMTAEAKVKSTVPLLLSATERANGFAMRFGGGIDLYATKHVVVSVGADYVLPFGDLKDLDYISIGWGIEYRF